MIHFHEAALTCHLTACAKHGPEEPQIRVLQLLPTGQYQQTKQIKFLIVMQLDNIPLFISNISIGLCLLYACTQVQDWIDVLTL